MTPRRAVVALTFSAFAFAACGSDIPTMSDRAARELASHVADVRAAIAAGDPEAANDELSDLHLVVVNMVGREEITKGKGESILAAARDVDVALGLMSPSTTTTLPTFDEDDDDEGNGNGHGKGKGKDKGGDD
jgi:hypothetical protein